MASTKNVRVTLPDSPGMQRTVNLQVTTRGPKADILLSYRGKEMTLFEKGGGKIEEFEDGGWVRDFNSLDEAMAVFAHKVTW